MRTNFPFGTPNSQITMQMSASSVIHIAPTKTLVYEVRDKKIRAMDEVGFWFIYTIYSFIN